MEGVYAWGLEAVRVIQRIEHPALTAVMATITALGSEYAYMALLPLVFWCVDERKGLRLGTAVLLSAWINVSLKDLWAQPRPYDLDPSVGRAYEPTGGIPSGHAQGSVTFWGILGSWLRFPGGLVLAIGAPLLISFTRLYLGVHFPTDLFAGWALGGLVLAGYFAFGRILEAALSAADVRVRILVAAAVAFVMNALSPAHTNLGGVFFGMASGYVLMAERFPFSAAHGAGGLRPSLPVLAARYILGIAGVAAVYLGLKLLLPEEGSSWYALGRFVRYGAMGAWVSAGAPWVFLRLKLAGGRVLEAPEASV